MSDRIQIRQKESRRRPAEKQVPPQNKTTPESGNGRTRLESPSDEQRARRIADLRRAFASLQFSASGAAVPASPRPFVSSKLLEYQDMVGRIRAVVRDLLPRDAKVAVVSKGDVELLKLEGRPTSHFPQAEDGAYLGYHPADSAAAIEHLNAARRAGATHLLFPKTAFWWMQFYGDFQRHLDAHYQSVARLDDTCVIYALHEQNGSPVKSRNGVKTHAPELPQETASSEDEVELRVNLARALNAAHRDDEARFILNDGLRTDPNEPRLLIELMGQENARGNKPLADRYAAQALAVAPDSYLVNFEVARLAWGRGQLNSVEDRLSHLSRLFPNDATVVNELLKLYCARIEGQTTPDAEVLARFEAHLRRPEVKKVISPEIHLRLAETLGGAGVLVPALASLETALRALEFKSVLVQEFMFRLLRPVCSDPATLPLADGRALSAFLTHTGNGFAATQDPYRSQACYHLAWAAENTIVAPLFNLAFQDMARGNPVAALDRLCKARRIYPEETARITWPTQNGRPWPFAPFNMVEAFEKLKPAGKKWPRISVVTPSYNQVAYIEETLLSVFNQHYPDLEFIVVDGMSTDGTVEILKRYEDKISKLVIEPDEGQTDALNKGMRLCTGDLIYWINSDDMLGPGTLFMIALTWLEEGADLIAGFCFEHNAHRYGIINLPAANHATFNVECLGDLFNYWFKGHFFYQPEVAFTRRIVEKVGGDICHKSNHYVMDYEFWVRCAEAGGTLATVHWPTGLFRKYPEQKGADDNPRVVEQGAIRDKYVVPKPSFERSLEIRRRLGRSLSAARPNVTVVSTRAGKIFSEDTARELSDTFAREGYKVAFHTDLHGVNPGESDLVILLVHLYKEHEVLRKFREAGHKGPVAGWYWDNHHHVFDNFRSTSDLDVIIPGHAFAGDYLRSRQVMMGDFVPLCVTQWTVAEAASYFKAHAWQKRSNALYGGYVRYANGQKRNKLIEQLIGAGMDGVYFLEEHALQRYFGLSLGDRFKEWASHKVSLSLPLAGDLSQRLFDALLAGQIPLVPNDVYDLERVVPKSMQEQLPIIRFNKYNVDSVREAHARALQLFDSQGEAGIQRRHKFAIENHMFVSRIRSILSMARGMALDV